MRQEQFEEYEYPKVPEYMTAEWMQEQIERERVDPRENPNLLLDENEQEFWDNAARKPYAKAILRSEQHWADRKKLWLRHYEEVEIRNQLREEVLEELEDCSMEVKRLVTPMLKYKICEASLWNAAREAHARGVPLAAVLERAEKLEELRGMRQRIDSGGARAAEAMLAEFTAHAGQIMDRRSKEKEAASRGTRAVGDTELLAKVLNFGQRCKKDGYIEWHKGNIEEALASWRQADEYLRRYKLPDEDERGNKMVMDMHLAILKNVAQASIRLGCYTEALEAADDALRLDDQDHKAWFRRACALEGLGRFDEEEEALAKIAELAVGRLDRERIEKDLEHKRARLQVLSDRSNEATRRGLGRALCRGVFSGSRPDRLAAGDLGESGAPTLPLEAGAPTAAGASPPAIGEAPSAGAEVPAAAGAASEGAAAEGEDLVVVVGALGGGAGDRGDGADVDGGGEGGGEGEGAGSASVEAGGSAEGGGGDRDCDAAPFAEGDVVVVAKALADMPRGRRGAVVEIDEDGDARMRFEGAEEDELIFRMDFHHFALDPSFAPSSPSPSSSSSAPRRRAPSAADHADPSGGGLGGDGPAAAAVADGAASAAASAAGLGDGEGDASKDLGRGGAGQRMRLGKAAASELLDELCRAYVDTAFQKRVAKLMRDVRWDRGLFVGHLRRVAMEVQAPVLARFGFEASSRGLAAAQLAVQDHTFGTTADSELQARSEDAARLLFGEMLPVLFPAPPLPPAASPLALGPEPPPGDEAPGMRRARQVIYGVG